MIELERLTVAVALERLRRCALNIILEENSIH